MSDGEQPAASQPESQPESDSAAYQSHCTSCGVPWASHMGIVGTCAEKAQLRKERDEARRLHCHMAAQFMYKSVELDTAKHVANSKGWDCYKEETK